MKATIAPALAAALALACGGGQDTESGSGNLGQSNKAGDDLDVAQGGGIGETPGPGGEDAELDAGVPEPPAAVTFVIKNTHEEDLVFSMDKGWQPNIFGFSGKPPKAKSIILFPKFCTTACDAAEEERCPHCPEPEKVKEIREAEKREVVPAGETLEVPWDGMVYEYQRTKGKRDGRTKRCECFSKVDVAAETYTVRICGLRVTKSAKKRTRIQCVDGQMTMPSEEPLRVEFEFADPDAKKKKK